MKVLRELNLENVVFFSIGTEVLRLHFDLSRLLDSKLDPNRTYTESEKEEFFEKKKHLYSEFSKISSITIGKIKEGELMLKTFSNPDEKILLTEFCTTLDKIVASNKKTVLCGYGLKGFDIPFTLQRCMVMGVDPCSLIDSGAAKPWELTAVDVLEIWKSSAYTTPRLINVAFALGIDYEKLASFEEDYSLKGYTDLKVFTIAQIVAKCRFESPIKIYASTEKEKTTPAVGKLQEVYNTKKINIKNSTHFAETISKMAEEEKIIANEIIELCAK